MYVGHERAAGFVVQKHVWTHCIECANFVFAVVWRTFRQRISDGVITFMDVNYIIGSSLNEVVPPSPTRLQMQTLNVVDAAVDGVAADAGANSAFCVAVILSVG